MHGRSVIDRAPNARHLTVAWSLFCDAVAEHRVLLVVIAIQVLVSELLCRIAHRPLFVGLGDAFITVDAALAIFGVGALSAALVHRRPAGRALVRGYADAWRWVRESVMTPHWVASVALLAIALPVSLDVFSAAKRAIPAVAPFRWDATFERISRAMHGGRHAWEWLQPLVGKPAVTVALDRYYHLGWGLLALGTLSVVIVSPLSRMRRRFVTAWVLLSFLGGTVAALAFSSAGPPFFSRIVSGRDPYAPLRAYLRGVAASHPLLSVGGRRALWSAYQRGLDAFGFGVSAMPSMHIATTSLVACLAFAVSRWAGLVAVAATIVMTAASVALCWHYAIDGYVGALLAIAVWWLAGQLERDGSNRERSFRTDR